LEKIEEAFFEESRRGVSFAGPNESVKSGQSVLVPSELTFFFQFVDIFLCDELSARPRAVLFV
jgi:hypothetical protein